MMQWLLHAHTKCSSFFLNRKFASFRSQYLGFRFLDMENDHQKVKDDYGAIEKTVKISDPIWLALIYEKWW